MCYGIIYAIAESDAIIPREYARAKRESLFFSLGYSCAPVSVNENAHGAIARRNIHAPACPGDFHFHYYALRVYFDLLFVDSLQARGRGGGGGGMKRKLRQQARARICISLACAGKISARLRDIPREERKLRAINYVVEITHVDHRRQRQAT